MNQEEIIKMAREAGFRVGPSRDGPDDVWGIGVNLARFAALVAAAEREACAKLCEGMIVSMDIGSEFSWASQSCATAIRARGQE